MNKYFEDYKSEKFRIAYLCNSLDIMCRKPLEFTEETLLETIKEKSPNLIDGCPIDIVKKAIHKWLPEARSKAITIELFKGMF